MYFRRVAARVSRSRWRGDGCDTNWQRCELEHPPQCPANVFVLTLGGFRTALGARVIACASPSKLDVTRTAGGADFTVDYTKDGWQKEVLEITGGQGVDLVYDPVGRIKVMRCSSREQIPTDLAYTDSLKCIAWSGRALVVGFAGGAIEKVRIAPCEPRSGSH